MRQISSHPQGTGDGRVGQRRLFADCQLVAVIPSPADVHITAYPPVTVLDAENSAVLPPGSVAVAVIVCPPATAGVRTKVKEEFPLALVVTLRWPMKVRP